MTTSVTFRGAAFLERETRRFDLMYADAWPGKFTHLDRALSRFEGRSGFVSTKMAWASGLMILVRTDR